MTGLLWLQFWKKALDNIHYDYLSHNNHGTVESFQEHNLTKSWTKEKILDNKTCKIFRNWKHLPKHTNSLLYLKLEVRYESSCRSHKESCCKSRKPCPLLGKNSTSWWQEKVIFFLWIFGGCMIFQKKIFCGRTSFKIWVIRYMTWPAKHKFT